MHSFVFDLAIRPEEWQRFYAGRVQHVVARARDGRTIRLAARHLQRFVTREGVRGAFRLTIDADSNFVSLERVG